MNKSHNNKLDLDKQKAIKLIRYYTSLGNVDTTQHAKNRMNERYLNKRQILLVLSSGRVKELNDNIVQIEKVLRHGNCRKKKTTFTVILAINKKTKQLLIITTYTEEPKNPPKQPVKVMCIETGEVFNSKREADRKLGLKLGSVHRYFYYNNKCIVKGKCLNFEIIDVNLQNNQKTESLIDLNTCFLSMYPQT
jgi:hypothetical protein